LGTEARQLIASSVDPLEERERLKVETRLEEQVLTFEAAAHKVHIDLKDGWKNLKHGQQWINTLTTYVFPSIGSKKLADITVNDVSEVLRPIWLSKSETASRVKQRIHQVMEWSCAQGLRVGNPVDGVKHLLPKQPSASKRVEHHPAMPWRLIPEFIADHIGTPAKVSPALLLFVILTAVRSGEARQARWAEFDLKKQVWTIPAARMKIGVSHRVPLAGQTVALLDDLKKRNPKSQLVFPSPKAGGILTDMALTSLMRKHKAPSDVPDRVATAHGFRSSFRDWASENNYPQHLAESALAHQIKNEVERAYHRTDLLEQRRQMMQNWANFVLS
jgi:integrase